MSVLDLLWVNTWHQWNLCNQCCITNELYWSVHLLTHLSPEKMAAIFTDIFKCVFLEWKCSLFLRFELTIFSTGSDNGLAPTRRQAIIWTSDGYRNWPRYGLRWSGWYCNLEQHELCRPLRGRLRPRRPAQRVLFRIAVPTTTAQTV